MELFDEIAALRHAGTPFALATVVWRRGATSGKPGARAIISADGSVTGWLGGACAQPTVVREALAALQDGGPRLLILGELDDRPGVTSVPMACDSEGSMEVFVEPVLPPPDLWVIGESPAAEHLTKLAGVLGWRTHGVDVHLDLSGADERSLVVVATQGHYDESALDAALATRAAYVGVVTSRKRAAGLTEWLRERGHDDAAMARIHAPAGLDLGATSHEEIAVAILAELVALKAAGAASPPVEVAAPATALDPVCGMTVDMTSPHRVERDGETFYFCSAGCQRAYERSTTSTVPTHHEDRP